MADTYLTRTPSSEGNRKIFTFSGWLKRSQLGATNSFFTAGYNSNNVASLRFNASDKLDVFDYQSSTQFAVVSNRLFRDTSAWYHIVMRVDTTQSTANDRVRLYVNGEQETSLTTNTQPSQNYNSLYNNTIAHYIGRYGWNNADSFDGSMSHINFCDGQSYAPTEFGETDTTTGQWKIKTELSVTYGTNGFFILKNGNTITDQSGEGNNFTLGGGTLTNTLDCPSNVFATWNALSNTSTTSESTLSLGNTKIVTGSTAYSPVMGTLGANSGKYYWEIKKSSSNDTAMIGIIADRADSSNSQELGQTAQGYGYASFNGYIRNNNSYIITSGYSTYANGDIIGVAMDLDNNKLYFSKNSIWGNSSNPSSSTNGISIVDSDSTTYGFYFPAFSDFSNTTNDSCEANFGNGYFGTTAVTDAGINASGIGIFEYDVPTGYTALSTKGLNL